MEKMKDKTQAGQGLLLEKDKLWQPKIAAFLCNWCSYAGADLAGTSRLKYNPQIRIIRVPCSGRVDPLYILRAFIDGADGVLVSGCHPGDCHYSTGNYYARRKFALLKRLIEFCGMDERRIHFSWVSAAEGAKWSQVVNEVVNAVYQAGPFSGFDRPVFSRKAEMDTPADLHKERCDTHTDKPAQRDINFSCQHVDMKKNENWPTSKPSNHKGKGCGVDAGKDDG